MDDKRLTFARIDFSNYDVIRNMILNRNEIMTSALYQQSSRPFSHEYINYDIEIVEYITEIYKELDRLLVKSKLNDKNRLIVDMLSIGYTISDIAKTIGTKENTVYDRLRRISLKINKIAIKERVKSET